MAKGIPIVWNPIFSSAKTPAAESRRAARKRLTRSFPRLERKLSENTRLFITLSSNEEALIKAFYGVDPSRFRRVPHGVDPGFSSASPALFREHLGNDLPFVLHCGSFTPGKNQLGLIRALESAPLQLVFIGGIIDEGYYSQCVAEAGDNVRFFGRVDHSDPMLPSAFAAATCFCLPSFNEVFPLTAMEAAVSGCSLVFSDTWGAKEIYGSHATYVSPTDLQGIRRAVEAAMAAGRNEPAVAANFLKTYSWESAARQLVDVYQEAISYPAL